MPATGTARSARRREESRPYQLDAVEAIASGLEVADRVQLETACGSGKTRMALRAAERVVPGHGLIVYLAPSIALVAQTLAEWRENATIPFEALAVCSDDTVEDTSTHVADLPVPVTTSETQIASWTRTTRSRKVIVGTYQSATRVAGALQMLGLPADMLICDEAHHLAGPATHRSAPILDADSFPAKRRLFQTATRRIGRNSTRGLGMDGEEFGKVVYRYPFARAIAEGYLDDYRVAVVGVTDSQIRGMLSDEDRSYTVGPDRLTLREAAAQVALAQAARTYGVRRVISFHHLVADAAKFARTLPNTLQLLDQRTGELYAEHVYGAMTTDEKRDILAHLVQPPPNGWTVIANARCLGEGIDVPACDGILFAHPKRSLVDIVQAVGRALRRHGKQSTATIVVPIIIPDHPADADDDRSLEEVDAGDYETLVEVINALRAHDSEFGDALDLARADFAAEQLDETVATESADHEVGHHAIPSSAETTGVAPGSAVVVGTDESDEQLAEAWRADNGAANGAAEPKVPGKVIWHLPPDTTKRLLRSLKVVVVRGATSPWWDGYAVARAYSERHGHLNVKLRESVRTYPLGTWLNAQRTLHRQGQLIPERYKLLSDLGVVWDPRVAGWQTHYELLAAWVAGNGTKVPTTLCIDGRQVGAWLRTQRDLDRDGRLAQERAAPLRELGVLEEIGRARMWEETVARLREFYAENGHIDLPPDHPQRKVIDASRAQRKNKTLNPERERVLTSLGLEWDPRAARQNGHIAALLAWYRKHGHVDIPNGTQTTMGTRLDVWWGHTKRRYKNGTLAADVATRLEDGGIDLAREASHPPGVRKRRP